jgi:Flp pilus assembly protein TadG
MVVAALLLSVVAMGVITIGRLGAVRADAQRAADAGALAALQVIRDRGLPFDNAKRQAAEQIARKNTGLDIALTWSVNQTATEVTIDVQASVAVDTPTMVFTGGTREVRARSTARLPQARFTEAERRLPKLALVLDYSGSMDLPFSGGSGKAIDVLEQSVAGLLNAGLDIDYGGVFYSDNVFRTIPIGAGAPNSIISTMNSYGAGGVTNTGAGLNAARNVLLNAPDTGRYVLLVSDGEPCCASNSFAAARSAGDALFNAGITTFTLEIRRSGSSAALDQFMTYVAGSPDSRHDRDYHYVATSASDLVNEFRRIVASIVCKVGPVSPVPSDLSTLRVYLAQGANERSVPATDDLVRDQALERYAWNAADSTIRLTATACDAVIDNGADIIVRFDRPGLTE